MSLLCDYVYKMTSHHSVMSSFMSDMSDSCAVFELGGIADNIFATQRWRMLGIICKTSAVT